MGSQSPSTSPAGMKLPTIKLDTTLAQLYKRASEKNTKSRIGLVLCGASSGLDLSPGFPRNKKYLYQDTPFNTEPPHKLTSRNKPLQRSLAMKYLSLIPQRDAFLAGPTPVVFFHTNPSKKTHDQRETETTVSVLDPAQKPELVFCDGPGAIPLAKHAIDKLAYKLALDDLHQYPLTHDLDTHWFLNSKAALAESGLPTPKSQVIRTDAPIPGLSQPPEKWIETQTARVVDAVSARQVPFVFKTQQTFGGAGTWVVASETAKEDLLRDLVDVEGPLHKLLAQVTELNAHLDPGAVVLSEMVRDPVGDFGITFLATDASSEPVILGVSEQMISDENAWVGSTISYSSQEKLQARFRPIVDQTAEFLRRHGYTGPVGIDVLEDKEGGEFIVDLNVRTSGSLALPLLKTHFMERGLACASSFGLTTKQTREEFIQRWKEEFEGGKMVVLSWYDEREGKEEKEGTSIADVVIGAEDRKELEKLMERVRKEGGDEVTF